MQTALGDEENFYTLEDGQGNTYKSGEFPVFFGSLDLIHEVFHAYHLSTPGLKIKRYDKARMLEVLGEGAWILYKSPTSNIKEEPVKLQLF